MKFLCPSCKAKYQIADEKVIGRTVKMKCRQCGRIIEINEAVIGDTGTPSIVPPKPAEVPHDAAANLPSAPKGTPPPKPVRVLTPPAGTAGIGRPIQAPNRNLSNPTLQVGKAAPVAPEKPRISAVPAPRPAPSKATGGMSPVTARHASSGGDPSKPTSRVPHESRVRLEPNADASLRESAALSSERESKPGKARATDAVVGRLPGVPATVISSLGAGATTKEPLAGAFTKAVVAASSTQGETADHPLAGDEWYVGVNDQPIGPIRLAEIRDRAAKGEITPDCLVWRDGFEDWKPLTAFPELVAVVEEGIASFRSLRPPAPSAPTAAAAPPLAAEIPAETKAAPPPPSTPSASASAFDDEPLAVPGLSKPKIPIAAWLAVFMALALGVTIGLVLIKPEPPKQIIKYVEVPVAAKQAPNGEQAPAPGANGDPNADTNGSNVAAGDKRPAAAPRKTASNGAPEAPAASANPEQSQGLKGLQGLQGLGAPRTGPAGDVGASAASHQQLDSATLSRTVSRYTASVKRSCWQPALDTRAPDASTSARISANIVVAPSGKVQSVTVSPDPKGYHGLSTCIQSRVRNWEFPPAGGTTEFNVPFVFAAQ